MEVVKIPGKNRGSTYYTCMADRGFFYRANKSKNGKTFLVCVEKGCFARASCNELLFTKIGEGHNHLQDLEKGEALVLKDTMLKAASTSSEDVKSIFVRQSASCSIGVASKLAFPATAKTMRRERRRVQPPMPATLEEFGRVCQDNVRFGKIDDGAFCRGVAGEGDSLSVLFLSENFRSLLAEAREVHVDGTFKTRPRHPASNQLLTIMVIHYGYAFPCAFALMSSRKTAAYNRVFEKLKEIVPQFQPQLIMSDFELALGKSLQRNFPEARKNGCFFHYCQALLKKARALGMTAIMKSNKDAKKGLKMLMAVAMLPSASIVAGVDYVSNFLVLKNIRENFDTLLRYHQSQWLEKVGVDALSVFGRARRTNNDNESFHATLQRLLRVRSPNVWEFTDGIRNIAATTARELEAFVHEGLQIRALGKRQYRLSDRKIKEASAQFANDSDVGRFLNTVSYSVERLFQTSFAEEEDDEAENNEEFLLAPLAGDLPPEFQIDNTHTNEAEEETEEDATEDEPPEIEEATADERYTGVCMICQTASPTTLLVPCGHLGLCDECCAIRQNLNNAPENWEDVAYDAVVDHSICPVDRIPVQQYIRVTLT